MCRSIAPFLYAWVWSDRIGHQAILLGAYFSIARKVAHRWKRKTQEPYEDLEQVAAIGLLKAIDRFEHELQFAFTSYAVPIISGEIHHYIRDKAGSIRVPRSITKMQTIVEKTRKNLILKGRVLSRYEVAIGLGYSADEAQQLDLMHSAMSPDSIHVKFDRMNTIETDETLYKEIRAAVRRLSNTHREKIEQGFFQNQPTDREPITIDQSYHEAIEQLRKLLEGSDAI